MNKLFSIMLMTLLCAGSILAEEKVQRVITIKNGNVGGIMKTIRDLLPGSPMLVSNSDAEHIILSGPKDTVTGFEEIIKQLDVATPSRNNIETTVYMIVASAQSAAAPLPPGLEPVVTQLKSIFSYKGFRLLDSFVLRSRSGDRGNTSGFLPPPADAKAPPSSKVVYQFAYNRISLDVEKEKQLVRYDHLNFGIKIPTIVNAKGEFSYLEAGISTDVDVPEGKKVVIGKTSAVEGSDSALILVISAKVVD
jgi:hypothetical protein